MRNRSQIYFVSTTGDDSWDGSSPEYSGENIGPFQTIQRAKEEVRRQIKQGLDAGITICIREGHYYLNEPLVFDENDSGTDDHRIIYKNYEEEKPVINGGKPITKWQPYNSDIYAADIGADVRLYSLFENGNSCIHARYPKQGYSRAIKSNDNPFKSLHFDKSDLPEIRNKDNLQIYVWPGGIDGDWNWFTNTINISSVDYDKGVIHLQGNASYEMGTGSRYFVQGALEFLTQPGEFYYDKKEGKLYYWPQKLPVEAQLIVFPAVNRIISFNGSSMDKLVKNIEFNGIKIMNSERAEQLYSVVTTDTNHNDNGTIYLENSENIKVINCSISNTGSHGICMRGYAQKNVIYGNIINNIGETGIYIEGFTKPDCYISRHNEIINNYIHDTGKNVGHGAGIQLFQSGENRVAHNEIRNTPRYAISLKSTPLHDINASNSYETKDNVLYSGYNIKNVIEYNDLSNANTDSQDSGVVEMWGGGSENIIRNNYIHDSDIGFSFGFGIYLDDRADFCLVENNIIEGLQKKGGGRLLYAIYAKGINDRIINNLMIDNNVFRAAIGTFEMIFPNIDIEIERNIVFESGDLYYFQNWDNNRFSVCDYNLIYNSEGRYGILNEIRLDERAYKELGGLEDIKWETISLDNWREMFNGKFDSHSIIANPKFRDINSKDYRLCEDSPAYELGFKDIDFDKIGLLKS